jgi:peptidoglycan/LPS O-acetylase OafA/YrhL
VADGRGVRWPGESLAPVIAVVIVVALIGLLLLPMLHEANAGSVSGANVLGSSKDVLCYGCIEDAPYPLLLFLELVVALCGLLVGFGLCYRGEGRVAVGRTVALVAAGLILLWAPLVTQGDGRPIAIVPVFVVLGIGALVLAVVAMRRSRSVWIAMTRAVVLAVATIAVATVPGTRGNMPLTYDRLLWGYFVALIASLAATAIAVVAVVRSSDA